MATTIWLTITEICEELKISRRTFHQWRATGRGPKCLKLPNGDIRIRISEYQRWIDMREEYAA